MDLPKGGAPEESNLCFRTTKGSHGVVHLGLQFAEGEVAVSCHHGVVPDKARASSAVRMNKPPPLTTRTGVTNNVEGRKQTRACCVVLLIESSKAI